MTRLLFALLILVPLAAAQEKVVVRRMADVVAVREGPRSSERVLYYFNPTVELVQGDHIEQGSGGHSEIKLPGEGLVILHANAHVILQTLAPEGDVLSFATVMRAEAVVGDRPLQLLLPGGTVCDLLQTHVTVNLEPGRLRVRNEGSTPVRVTSDLRLEREPEAETPVGRIELLRGEEVRLVLVGGPVEPAGETLELWGAVPVRHSGGIEVLPEGDILRIKSGEGTAGAGGILTVRGVHTVPRAGLLLRNLGFVPMPVERPVEEPAPPPAADEPSAPEPDEAPTPPPADEGDVPPGDQPR